MGNLLLVSLYNHFASLSHHFASLIFETFTPALKYMTDQTDSSAHCRLFLDGRLAGSSCLVGCAGIGPWRTSWQPRSRQPTACLSSSGMIRVEQKHHSTQSLDPCLGAICKTLHSNTRASYDLQQGVLAGKKPRPVLEVNSTSLIAFESDCDIRKMRHEGLLIRGLSRKVEN